MRQGGKIKKKRKKGEERKKLKKKKKKNQRKREKKTKKKKKKKPKFQRIVIGSKLEPHSSSTPSSLFIPYREMSFGMRNMKETFTVYACIWTTNKREQDGETRQLVIADAVFPG